MMLEFYGLLIGGTLAVVLFTRFGASYYVSWESLNKNLSNSDNFQGKKLEMKIDKRNHEISVIQIQIFWIYFTLFYFVHPNSQTRDVSISHKNDFPFEKIPLLQKGPWKGINKNSL